MASSSGPDPAAAGPVKVFLYDDTTSRQAFAKPVARGASISKWATNEPSYFKYPGVDEDDVVSAAVNRPVATSQASSTLNPSQISVRHGTPPSSGHSAPAHQGSGWDVAGPSGEPDLEKHAREDSGYSAQASSVALKICSSPAIAPARVPIAPSSSISAPSSIQIAGRAKQAVVPSDEDAWDAWQADDASAASSGAAAFAKRAQISASPPTGAATSQLLEISSDPPISLQIPAASDSRSDLPSSATESAQSEDPWAPGPLQQAGAEADDWATYTPSGPSGGAEAYAKRAALSKSSGMPASRPLQRQPSIRSLPAAGRGKGTAQSALAKSETPLVASAQSRRRRSAGSKTSSTEQVTDTTAESKTIATSILLAPSEKLLDFDSPAAPPATDTMDLSIISELSGLRFEADAAYAYASAAQVAEEPPAMPSGLVAPGSPESLRAQTRLDDAIPVMHSAPLAPTVRSGTDLEGVIGALRIRELQVAAAQPESSSTIPLGGSETFDQAIERLLRARGLSLDKQRAVAQELQTLGKKEKMKCLFSEDFLVTKVKQAIQLVELDEQEEEL